ncbi:hypothetical protein IR083_22090 [Dysgonomonas sp. GY75]|uniref:type IIL restriction-modification enzyme MmeI n=1 Tax=Dysgonomonas sp. GY75 TaxID=2780419 RepID=UPI0018831A08|nr:type IIL restriction-modification enzyme MmeI [Dysgonomonas sp. GY75]MBF0651510.1 hypothetical protein [Dysgonomonas sp. GY75]
MPLASNKGKSFQGSIVLGKGFVLSPEEAEKLIKKDPRNKEVLFPYLNGDDLNNDPEQKPSRWVINFFDWDEEKAKTYPDCYEIVERLVKPERLIQKDKGGKEKWWQFLRPRKELYNTISELDQVMVVARISKTLAMYFVPQKIVFADALVVFSDNSYSFFCILQSTIHNIWAWKYCTTMKSDLNYTPGNVFETFPFPKNLDIIEHIGNQYFVLRDFILKNLNIGLTKMNNLIHNKNLYLLAKNLNDDQINHDKDILWFHGHLKQNKKGIDIKQAINYLNQLRDLHVKLDYEVINIYGWSDLELQHDFYELEYLPENDNIRFTIHPDTRKEVLKRLLLLNHQLYENEVTGEINTKPKKVQQKRTEDNSPKLF